jgi:hypothetical protein
VRLRRFVFIRILQMLRSSSLRSSPHYQPKQPKSKPPALVAFPSGYGRSRHAHAHLHRLAVLGSMDDVSASADDLTVSQRDEQLIAEVTRIEVLEPIVEEKGESAALAVAAAVAFGAGVWALLGRAKGEGGWHCCFRKL